MTELCPADVLPPAPRLTFAEAHGLARAGVLSAPQRDDTPDEVQVSPLGHTSSLQRSKKRTDLGEKRQVEDQVEPGLGKATKLQRSPSCTFQRGILRILATRADVETNFCSTIDEGSCPYVQTKVAPGDLVDHVEVPTRPKLYLSSEEDRMGPLGSRGAWAPSNGDSRDRPTATVGESQSTAQESHRTQRPLTTSSPPAQGAREWKEWTASWGSPKRTASRESPTAVSRGTKSAASAPEPEWVPLSVRQAQAREKLEEAEQQKKMAAICKPLTYDDASGTLRAASKESPVRESLEIQTSIGTAGSAARSAERARLEAEKAWLELKLAALMRQEAPTTDTPAFFTQTPVPHACDEELAGSSSGDEDLPLQRRAVLKPAVRPVQGSAVLKTLLPRTGSYHYHLDRRERQKDAKSSYVQTLKNDESAHDQMQKMSSDGNHRQHDLGACATPHHSAARGGESVAGVEAAPHHSAAQGGESVAGVQRDSRDFRECVVLLQDMRLHRGRTEGGMKYASDSGRTPHLDKGR